MKKIVAIILGLSAPLLFPAVFALVLVFLAAIIFPPIGILAGILTDMLYHAGGSGFPYATYVGIFISLSGLIVHRFIKTRIIGA